MPKSDTFATVDRQFEFEKMTYTGKAFGFMNVEETSYGDEYGNNVTYKFVKVAGINIDLTDCKQNLLVLEQKKLKNEQLFDD